jgi:hypothetical protein
MLLLTLDAFDSDKVFLGNSLKNNIIHNGSFSHINYSTNYFSLNTIYIDLPFKMKLSHSNNKVKIAFKKKENDVYISKIKCIEEDILKIINKPAQYKISQYLENENIIIHSKPIDNFTLILKISGIWETEDYCGLTFKFIIHPLKNKLNLSYSST